MVVSRSGMIDLWYEDRSGGMENYYTNHFARIINDNSKRKRGSIENDSLQLPHFCYFSHHSSARTWYKKRDAGSFAECSHQNQLFLWMENSPPSQSAAESWREVQFGRRVERERARGGVDHRWKRWIDGGLTYYRSFAASPDDTVLVKPGVQRQTSTSSRMGENERQLCQSTVAMRANK